MKIASSSAYHIPRILIIEENPLFRQLLSTMIKILGAHCSTPNDVETALAAFQAGFDLVLLDLRLENTSGFELAEHMRSIEAESGIHRTPIIGHATVALPEDVEPLCRAAGMDSLIPKLPGLHETYELLTRWLSRPFVMPVHLLDVYVPTHK